MPGLDHAVIVSNDLPELAAAYEALGFTLTPTAQHPWGTANRLVQFEGRNFLELLTVDRPELVAREPETAPGGTFSFGRHIAEFLAHGAGMAMLALQGTDYEADIARWRAAGLVTYEPFHFERKAALPDGTVVTVAFSLAYTTHPALPGLAFFTCQQHHPEHFWKAPYQRHDNDARELVEVSLATPEPRRLASFLSGLTGSESRIRPDGIECAVGPHRLVVRDAAYAGAERDGETGLGARFLGLSIRVGPNAPRRGTRVAAGGVFVDWV
jgi:hypothetical protein